MLISNYIMDKEVNFNTKLNLELDNSEVFIYGFGFAGKWLSDNISNKVLAFIDTDRKKTGSKYNGINVLSIEESTKVLNNNSEIIVTVVDIQDVISILENLPKKKWTPLGLHLNDTKALINKTGEKDSYIEYSIKTVEDCHKAFFNKEKLFMRSIDLVITEKCSLKCKDCANLMQYYEAPVNISYEELITDFDNLIKNVDYVHEIRLIGGEPFMNKDIYKILEYISSSSKISKIVIYTNATIPIKEKEYEIKVLQNHKILFALTDYGSLSKNTNKIVFTLDRLGIAYRRHPPENWTDSGKIYNFNRSIPELKKIFNDCCGKNLLTLTGGKIYRCPFAANTERLQAIPNNKKNSVLVNSSKENIKKYISDISYLPACNFCQGRSFDAPEIKPAVQVKNPIPYQKFSSY